MDRKVDALLAFIEPFRELPKFAKIEDSEAQVVAILVAVFESQILSDKVRELLLTSDQKSVE